MGAYDAIVRYRVRDELRDVGKRFVSESRALRDPSSRSEWLDRFGRDNAVFVRIVDLEGETIASSEPRFGEGRVATPGALSRVADFFFGPSGPPNLAAHESSLPRLAEREEVRAALAGKSGEAWQAPPSTKYFAFYRVEPLPGIGAVHFTQLSRRSVRGLYDLRYQLLKLSLGLLVVALVFGFWLSRRIAKPIEEIQRSVRLHLATGASVPLALETDDELGDLSRDFDELASRLSAQTTRTAQVSADLAHDLKSPLSTVAASAELLEDVSELDDAKRQRIAAALANAAAHMGRSIDALLALARLDERLVNEHRERTALAPIVRRIVESYQQDPTQTQLSFEFACRAPGETAVAFVVEARVEQAIRNLIDNAVVFASTRIEVVLSIRDGDFVIEVADDGPGVSAGNRDKVFTRFFSSRPQGSEPGTGLGLAICQAIAGVHGGRVELAREARLGGASFLFVAPRVVELKLPT